MSGTSKLDVLKHTIAEDLSKTGAGSYYVECGWRLTSLQHPALVCCNDAVTPKTANSLDEIKWINWSDIVIEEINAALHASYIILISKGDEGWDEIVEFIEMTINAAKI